MRAAILLCLALQGCAIAPDRVSADLEHVSHPGAGWPIGPRNDEDALNQLSVTGRWQSGRLYVEHGLGVNLAGTHGGGFYGPAVTYTGRVGIELWRKGQ